MGCVLSRDAEDGDMGWFYPNKTEGDGGTDIDKLPRAGPSAIHMASQLIIRGYTNITLLEKDEELEDRYGKTYSYKHPETGTAPNEFGTCYLSSSYTTIFDLLREYVGEDALIIPGGEMFDQLLLPAPRLREETHGTFITSDDWLYANREKNKLSPKFWCLPDKFQALGFAGDILRYRILHQSLLGEYNHHGLPPKPNEKSLKLLNITYGELLIKNGLKALLDLCCVGFGSYGFGYNVPALYGLWFVDPVSVEAYIKGKFSTSVKPVQLVKNGYSELWKNMIARHEIKIQYKADIKNINRNLQDRSKPIEIEFELEGESKQIEADFLIFAAPMNTSFLPIVKDATEFETEVCNSMANVALCVHLFKTEKKPSYQDGIPEQALVFYPESLQSEYTPIPNGQLYAERNTIRAYQWNEEDTKTHRYDVAYQLFTEGVKSDEYCKEQAIKFMKNADLTLNPTPGTPEQLNMVNYPNYFPHFTNDAIQKLLPWKVFEAQGTNRTWYIGSSVSFESVEDVTSYNNQILKLNGLAAVPAPTTTKQVEGESKS